MCLADKKRFQWSDKKLGQNQVFWIQCHLVPIDIRNLIVEMRNKCPFMFECIAEFDLGIVRID